MENFKSARDYQIELQYSAWNKFELIIQKAINLCEKNGFNPKDHFIQYYQKTHNSETWDYNQRLDYQLSELAQYYIARCGNKKRPNIQAALAHFDKMAKILEIVKAVKENKLAQIVAPDIKKFFDGLTEDQKLILITHLVLENEKLSIKADLYDRLVVAPGEISLIEAAKLYRTNKNKFFKDLREKGYLTEKSLPTHKSIQENLIVIKMIRYLTRVNGQEEPIIQYYPKAFITPRGLAKFQPIAGRHTNPLPYEE
jgi:phage antirepressor YoqD-like protein